jgi:Flp pilus assembly protein TadB
MLDTSRPLRTANGAPQPARHASVAGLVAAAIWAAGAAAGVLALVMGHIGLAIAALIVAVVAPWVGLARVSHGHRRTYSVASAGRHLSGAHWGPIGVAETRIGYRLTHG